MQPHKIAIIGGIGSGKSVVSRLFRLMNIPVYDCDSEAKRLMNTSAALRSELTRAIDERVYGADGRIDRAYLASYMFGNAGHVALVNSIVLVSAPIETRISRAILRDHSNEQAIRQRMKSQMSDTELVTRANHIILNDDTTSLIVQVKQVIQKIASK